MKEHLTFGEKLADKVTSFVGSWRFIGIQTTFLVFWVLLNIFSPANKKPDPYPFILLNLMLSFQAAYTGPILLISANRQAQIDRDRSIETLSVGKQEQQDIINLIEHIDRHFDNINQKIENIQINTNIERQINIENIDIDAPP